RHARLSREPEPLGARERARRMADRPPHDAEARQRRCARRDPASVTGEPLVLIGVVGAAGGVVLTILSIVRLVRLARQPELARAPVAETASVTFADPGPVELALEGPQPTTLFRGLDFALADAAGR